MLKRDNKQGVQSRTTWLLSLFVMETSQCPDLFGTLAAAHNPGMFLLALPEMLSGGKAYEKINEYSIQRL